MIHRIALTLASVTLALGGWVVQGQIAHAYRCGDPDQPLCTRPPAVQRLAARSVVTSYFTALNRAMATGDISAVTALFTPTATLTMRTFSGQTQTLRGSAAIASYVKAQSAAAGGATWKMDEMQSLDGSVILAYAHVTKPSTTLTGRWTDIFVIKRGRIASLDAIAF